MSKDIWGWLKASPVVLGLNLFILIAPFINWRPVVQETTQKLYLVFGVFILYILSLFSKPKRQLQDWRIGVFLAIALFSVFWHSKIWVDSITFRYLDFYLMSEGFIHVFAAVLLYKLVYEYVDKLPVAYCAATIYLFRAFSINSLTPIFSVAICSLIYAIAKKKKIVAGLIIVWAVLFLIGEHTYIYGKWQARAFAWPYTIKEIWQHPFGTGFDKSIMQNLILGPNGWHYIHSDYLNVVRDLGILVLIPIGFYLIEFFKKFKAELLFLVCLGTLLIMGAQTSAYFPRFSILMVSLWAIWRIKCQNI